MRRDDTKKLAPPDGEAKEKIKKLIQIRNQSTGNSCADQAGRLWEALHSAQVSTLEARRYLDIMHPAGRVQRLREAGHLIDTLRHFQFSETGKPHRVAVYVLRKDGEA